MSNFANGEKTAINQQTDSNSQPTNAHCSTYTFPEAVRSPEARGHLRSVSHGGGTTFGSGSGSAGVVGRSALKGARGHQRALSQGQISDSGGGPKPGHSRVGSKTDFILPPGYKELENAGVAAPRSSAKGHSRQASRLVHIERKNFSLVLQMLKINFIFNISLLRIKFGYLKFRTFIGTWCVYVVRMKSSDFKPL